LKQRPAMGSCYLRSQEGSRRPDARYTHQHQREGTLLKPSKIPDWLKPRIVPLWNRSYHATMSAQVYLDALVRGRVEHCSVCGRVAPILLRRDVIPPRLVEMWGLPPDLVDLVAQRESCECARCGAKLRARQLARALLQTFPSGFSGDQHRRSIRDWVAQEDIRTLRIAEINRIDGLHTMLFEHPRLVYSEFLEGVEPGHARNGTRCENLMNLTYNDASFDLVLTSETLEHLPDLSVGLSEIHRVLVPGGYHLFTVPLRPDVHSTYPRARLGEDGVMIPLVQPVIRHPGGDIGYPVFTEFGADLPDLLRAAGFEVTLFEANPNMKTFGQVFVTRKREIPEESPPSPISGTPPTDGVA